MGTHQGRATSSRIGRIATPWLAATVVAVALTVVTLPGRPAMAATTTRTAPAGLSTVPGSAWVATWAAAPVAPLAHGRSAAGFGNQTVRQVVRTSIGGTEVRVRFTNAFGTRPVLISGAGVAVRARGAALVPGTDHALTVGGARAFTLAPGAAVTSDPVAAPVGTGTDLAVSAWFAAPTGPATWHPLALTTNYVAAGDHVADSGAGAYGQTTSSWWLLGGVDVLAPTGARAVVAFGASTSDGEGTAPNAHARWVDDLNRRLDATTTTAAGGDLAVVDEGVAGNRLLSGGPGDGPSGDARFQADAATQPGVRDVIVSSLGNDDIGHGHQVTAAALIAGYQRIIAQAHAAGLRIIGATLTPDRGAGMWTPAGEQVQEQVNHWILTSHAFDATVDFAAAVADPGHPDRLAPRYDSGDHLHPNAAGYAAIAAAISPALLTGPVGM